MIIGPWRAPERGFCKPDQVGAASQRPVRLMAVSASAGRAPAAAARCPEVSRGSLPGMTSCMTARQEGTRYSVRLSVPRRGGWRAWGAASGNFERRLGEQDSAAIIAPHIEGETRRGRDHVRVTVVMAIGAPDIAQALTAAWWVFRKAAGSDAAGWDMAGATAEVRPEDLSQGPRLLIADAPHLAEPMLPARPPCQSSGPADTGSSGAVHAHRRSRSVSPRPWV